MDADAVGVIFGDISAGDFFSRSWGKAPALFPGPPERFDGLFGWDDFLALLDRHGPDLHHRLRVVQNGSTLGQHSYTLNDRTTLAGRSARVLPERINALCAGGASLVLSGVRDYGGRLGEFARQLERQLRAPVSVNAYYTPAGNRAFGVHYDPYDVFVLQLLGRKHWKLFGLRTPAPLLDDPADFSNAPETPEQEHVLEAGQALYVPRGVWHVAGTSDASGSLHLTFGVRSHTYADLLERLLNKLKDAEPARARLAVSPNDLGHLAFDEKEILASLETLLRDARGLAPAALGELDSPLGQADSGFSIPRP